MSEQCRSVGVSECRTSVGAVSEAVGECRTGSDMLGHLLVSEVSEVSDNILQLHDLG